MLKIIDTHFHLPTAEEKSFAELEAQIGTDIVRAAEALSIDPAEITLGLVRGASQRNRCRAYEKRA